MSAFAGFVNGVFNGMDWREARDDRKRKRKWEIEDREHAMAGRGRTVGGWAEEDEAKTKAAAEKAEAEAREQRIEESRRRAMGYGDETPAPSREMSVMPDVPPTQQPAPETPQPPQRGALSVMGLGDLGAGATGRSMGEAVPEGRRRPHPDNFNVGEPVPQQQAAAPAQEQPQPVQMAEAAAPQGQPDPALVAEGARIAGVQPYVPDVPGEQRGFNLNNLIASSAAASTIPEGGPQRPTGQATQDAVHGRGQGYSDYTEATRGFRSDAPRRGTVEDMVAAEQAGQPRPAQPQQTGPVPMLSAADAERSQRAISLFPQGQDFDTQEEAAAKAQASTDRQQSLQARRDAVQSRRESANTSAAMAAGVEAPQQQPTATPTPQPQGQPAPAAAPGSQTPEQQAEQRERAPGAYSFNLGGAEMSISRANRKLTGTVADVAADIAGAFDPSGNITGSLKAAGDAIAESPSMSAADALRDDKPPKQAEVRAASKQAAVRFQREEVERHAKLLESEGMLKEAQAWREYAQSANTQRAMEKLSEAMFYWNMNDEGRALQSVVDLYNMNGYYEDGLSALSEGTAFQYDAQGNINGLTVTFRDEATGNVFQQTINGPRDKVMAMVIGGLSPEATFAAALEAVGGVGGPEQQAPQMTPELSLKIDAEARQQAEKDDMGNPTPATIEAARQRILRNMGFSGAGAADVPLMD